jgi:serine/threonine protein kinase
VQVGEVLNGYRITTPPTNAGGGMSQWSFAEKDGRDFFFKMFLAPKFPLDDGPGSPTAKARKRATCLAFEERHLDIAQRLQTAAPGSGNLVIPRDFFRVDATYVKVMDRVVPVSEPTVPMMEPQQRLVFLRSLAYSLQLLHGQDVVHGDLKPDNVLVQQAGPGLYAAMLIDFDEGYVVGKPPSPEHIVGDPGYYSPELLRYIKRDERLPADALSTASDMFSFGLLLHWFLTGEAPRFDRTEAKYPAEALLMRQLLDVSAAPQAFRGFLSRMLDIVPSARPTIGEVIAFFSAANAAHVSGEDVSPVRVAETSVELPAARLTMSGPLRTTGDVKPTTGPVTGGGAPPSDSTTGPSPTTDPGAGAGLRSTMGKRKPRPPGGIPSGPPTAPPA